MSWLTVITLCMDITYITHMRKIIDQYFRFLFLSHMRFITIPINMRSYQVGLEIKVFGQAPHLLLFFVSGETTDALSRRSHIGA